MNSRRSVVMVLSLILSMTAGAAGATIHVATTGNDVTGDGSLASPYATIQKGIDSCAGRGTVLVQPGTYAENITFRGKSITVMSTYGRDRDLMDGTVIDGGAAGSVVTIASRERAAVLAGFTLTNGEAGQGGGIFCDGARARIIDCIIAGNTATETGDYVGGGGVACVDRAFVRIEGCVITGNSGWMGGGVGCFNGSLAYLDGPEVSGNTAGCGGGGVCFFNASGRVVAAVVNDNVSDEWDGGGILAQWNSTVYVGYSDVKRNTANGGGGICFIEAGRNGRPRGAVVYCDVSANVSRIGGGAGIHCQNTGPVAIAGTLLSGNVAKAGGAGLLCEGTGLIALANSTVAQNEALDDGGGGVAAGWGPTLRMANCILADNVAPMGSQLGAWGSPSRATVEYCCIRGGLAGVYNDGASLTWDDTNIDADPLFAAIGSWDDGGTPADPDDDVWQDGDYHLQSTAGRWDPAAGVGAEWVLDAASSPCIDAGAPSSPFAREPRPNGRRIDMGCYGNTVVASKSPSGVTGPGIAGQAPRFCQAIVVATRNRLLVMQARLAAAR